MLPKTRILAIVLLGIGAALIVAGLLLPRFIHSDARLPLNLGELTWTVQDNAAQTRVMTDPEGRVVTAPVTRQLHVILTEPSNANTVAVRAGTSLLRGSQQAELDRLISAQTWTYSLDRRSGQATTDAAVSDQLATPPTSVALDGDLWWKFPAAAEQTTYEVFDDILRAPVPATFVEETQLGGETVYRYRQVVEPSNLRERYEGVYNSTTFADGTSGDLYYEATRDFYVDPVSGLVVGITEEISQYYGTQPGDRREIVLEFDGSLSQDNIAELQADAAQVAGSGLVGILGWVSVGLGAVTVVLGIIGALLAGSQTHTRLRANLPNRGVAHSG